MKLGCGHRWALTLLDFVGWIPTYYISQIMFDSSKNVDFGRRVAEAHGGCGMEWEEIGTWVL